MATYRAPGCILQGIHKLPPGALLCFEAQHIRHRVIPTPIFYWKLSDAILKGVSAPLNGSEEELADLLEKAIIDAVDLRRDSDAPMGAFLSGGIDSSTVVTFMQQSNSRPVRTFCIGSQSREFNEAHWARAMAKRLGTEHVDLLVTPKQVMDVIPELPGIYDEPFADFSQVPTVLVSRLARPRGHGVRLRRRGG